MRFPRITLRRALVLGALLLLAACLIAPYLRADRFGRPIRAALEQSLGRQVEVGEVRLSLFRGPGFSLQDVVIAEDPAAGIEPFAYVKSLEASIALRTLWTGRLEFSSLRLVDPSVNLVKTPAGPWNFQPLLGRALSAELPEIHVRGGRLNFKFGDMKSVFYFTRTDFDIVPSSVPGGPFELRFSGEPSRTDRASFAFGSLTGRGRWQPSPGAQGRLQLDLALERSAIGELITLVHGQDIGVHGRVAARARVEGPISDLAISGGLQLEDIHRWDLMPPYAQGGPLSYQGHLNLVSQTLDLETVPDRSSALTAKFRVADYLSKPRWALSLALNRLSSAPAIDVARHLGAPIPPQLVLDGELTGDITYSPEDGFHGHAGLSDSVVALPGHPPVRFRGAEIEMDGSRVQFSASLAGTEKEETAQLAADYSLDARRLGLKITTAGLEIPADANDPSPLLGMAGLPLLRRFRGGVWVGWLEYMGEGENPGKWTGEFQLRDTEVALPVVGDPMHLSVARVSLQGDRVAVTGIRGRLGKLELEGEYRHLPGTRRPHRWRCVIRDLEAFELERLMLPVLDRKQGFLSRTFGIRRRALPGWLQDWHSEGSLEVKALSLAGVTFEAVKTRILWDTADVQAADLTAQFRGGQIRGRLSVDLKGSQPAYRIAARIQSMSWKAGKLDLDGSLTTRGLGANLLLNLRAEGSFNGSSVSVGPELRFRTASGGFVFSWLRGQPSVGLQDLRLAAPRGVFIGQGATQPDGRLRIDLTGGEEQLRLAGSLTPLQLEVEETR